MAFVWLIKRWRSASCSRGVVPDASFSLAPNTSLMRHPNAAALNSFLYTIVLFCRFNNTDGVRLKFRVLGLDCGRWRFVTHKAGSQVGDESEDSQLCSLSIVQTLRDSNILRCDARLRAHCQPEVSDKSTSCLQRLSLELTLAPRKFPLSFWACYGALREQR